MSQPGRARLAGVSRWVSRQIRRRCRALLELFCAIAEDVAPSIAPFTMTVRRVSLIPKPLRPKSILKSRGYCALYASTDLPDGEPMVNSIDISDLEAGTHAENCVGVERPAG